MTFSIFSHYLFFITIVATLILSQFSDVSLIVFGPLLITTGAVFLSFWNSGILIKKDYWLPAFFWTAFAIYALIYYMLSPVNGQILSVQSLQFFILPVILLSLLNAKSEDEGLYIKLCLTFVLAFLVVQFVFCVGQYSTYLFGVGLPVNMAYARYFMVSGTYFNGNDLAAMLLPCAYFIKYLPNKYRTLQIISWILIFLLVFITVSRSAIAVLLIIFFSGTKINPVKVIIFAIVIALIVFILPELDELKFGNPVIDRVFGKIFTFQSMSEAGITSDDSMEIRLMSYLYFVTQVPVLGFGSGELFDYYQFASEFSMSDGWVFRIPHSLIVEIGYWLGIIGLLVFFLSVLISCKYTTNTALLVMVVLIFTSIPSSLIGSLMTFPLMFVAFFNKRVVDS